MAFGGPLLPPFCGLTRRSLANNLGRPRRFLPAARFGPALGGTERGASLLARAVESEPMPRDGAITLTDLQAPFLRVVCEPCGPRGRYAVARLIAEGGDAKLTDLPSRPRQLPADDEFRREHL